METEVTLQAYTGSGIEKNTGGDAIYLNITNGCEKLTEPYCQRLSSSHIYYTNDVLDNPIVIKMTDNKDGTYTTKYIVINKAGYISLSLFKAENEELYGECFTEMEWKGNAINLMRTGLFDFD